MSNSTEKQEPVAIGEEWKPCVKLPIIVHVREQRKGETHVSTREGITPVKEDDLIMRGVAGEEYPIGRELFNRTYTFDTAPVHASDISQECVDEIAKHGHEPVAWREVVGKTTMYYDYNEEGRGEPLYSAPQPDLARVGEVGVWGDKREWVGLAEQDVHDAFQFTELIKQLSFDRERPEWCENFAAYLEAKLKEKNR